MLTTEDSAPLRSRAIRRLVFFGAPVDHDSVKIYRQYRFDPPVPVLVGKEFPIVQ